jgi:hypothetical protein
LALLAAVRDYLLGEHLSATWPEWL